MDGITIIAIVSALCGWGTAGYMMRSRDRYREAWINQCEQTQRESQSRDSALARVETHRMAATAAMDELRIARAALRKCVETNTAMNTAMEELDKERLGAIDLAAARWKQIEELRGEVL